MSYKPPVDHVFLYHAYALAAGGWLKTKDHEFIPLESIAPSVLSITGGYSSASAHNVNSAAHKKHPFGKEGPPEFFVYVGHAFTEVRGIEVDEEGIYQTSVRSVLDDFRINDVIYAEHAETVLVSKHRKPGTSGMMDGEEGEVFVGDSNMSGLKVHGKSVKLKKHDSIDHAPTHGGLQKLVAANRLAVATAGKGGPIDDWTNELSKWNDLDECDDGAPKYAKDLAEMNRKAHDHVRYSIFKDVDVPKGLPGVNGHKSSIEVDNFGRIFLGEVFVSNGMKQVTMLRFDLGCDNCGGYGGSGGTTNGVPYPP